MSNENDDDRYAVYILNVPLQFGSNKLNNLLKTNEINATLVFSVPKKGEKFANVKAILDNAEDTLTLLKKRTLNTNVSAANQPPKVLNFDLSLFPKEDRVQKQDSKNVPDKVAKPTQQNKQSKNQLRCIHVSRLVPKNLDEEFLRKIFHKYGRVLNVILNRELLFAVIKFSKPEEAENVMKNKQNIKISQNIIFSPGSCALQVNPDLSLTLDLSEYKYAEIEKKVQLKQIQLIAYNLFHCTTKIVQDNLVETITQGKGNVVCTDTTESKFGNPATALLKFSDEEHAKAAVKTGCFASVEENWSFEVRYNPVEASKIRKNIIKDYQKDRENESKESKKVNENVENKIQNQKIKSTETIVKNTDVKQHKQTNKKTRRRKRSTKNKESKTTVAHTEIDRAIVVTNFSMSTTPDVLKLYFENKKRSNGGVVESVDTLLNEVYIVFKNAEDQINVLNKSDHVLDDKVLRVHKKINPKLLDDRFLLVGIPENTDRSVVEMLLENCDVENQTTPKSILKVDKNVFCIRYSSNKSGVVDRVKDQVLRKPFQNVLLTIRQVYQTHCLRVRNVNPSTSNDFIDLFFSNVERSNGRNVSSVMRIMNGSECLVFFADCNTVDNIVKSNKKLEIDHFELKVEYCYDYMKVLNDQNKQNENLIDFN